MKKLTNLIKSFAPTAKLPRMDGVATQGMECRRKRDKLPAGVQILEPGYAAREDLSSLRVLVVDDNRFHRSLVRNALVSQGIHSHWEAADAKEAEKTLTDQAIDLLIMDNNMPGEKGITFTRRLREGKSAGSRYIPIIMVTAYGDEKIIRAARDAGVHEYILKPFNIMTLVQRTRQTFKSPRDFIIAPGYVGPDRRWEQKQASQFADADRPRTAGTRETDAPVASDRLQASSHDIRL